MSGVGCGVANNCRHGCLLKFHLALAQSVVPFVPVSVVVYASQLISCVLGVFKTSQKQNSPRTFGPASRVQVSGIPATYLGVSGTVHGGGVFHQLLNATLLILRSFHRCALGLPRSSEVKAAEPVDGSLTSSLPHTPKPRSWGSSDMAYTRLITRPATQAPDN